MTHLMRMTQVMQTERVTTSAVNDVRRFLGPLDRGQGQDVGEWMSIREAAAALEVSPSTVLRSLTDEARRKREWGEFGEGWRTKPLSDRGDYQLRRSVVERKAGAASAE
jgi:hypothetical protein